MIFSINQVTLIFISVSVGLFLLLILLMEISKKGTVGKGKKGLVRFLLVLDIIAFSLTTLVHFNIVPLSLHLGYWLDITSGHNTGIKLTMEKKFAYYSNMNMDNPKDSHNDFKGEYRIVGNFVTLYNSNDTEIGTYEIKDFGKSLYQDGQCVYKYFKDIDLA